MLKTGDVLIHPAHGEMVVRNVGPFDYEEYIDAEKCFKKGYRVQAVFDRFIPGVKWNVDDGKGGKLSMLIFHSYYLKNLKLKETNE